MRRQTTERFPSTGMKISKHTQYGGIIQVLLRKKPGKDKRLKSGVGRVSVTSPM